jgi:hypothetical protein
MELMAVYQHLWVIAVSGVEKSQAGQIQAWVFQGIRTGLRASPAAHEHLVEIGKTDFEPGRPAVIALASTFSHFHLP